MTFEERQAATQTVVAWITEAHGNDVAYTWAIECTPMPCGLPSDAMLDEGLAVATGELSIKDLTTRVYAEMEEQCA